MINPERTRGNGLFERVRQSFENRRHRQIASRLTRPFVDIETLIDFVETAPLNQSGNDRSQDAWRAWADRFFYALFERSGNEQESHAPLDHAASRLPADRYALMIEMLGIYAEGSDRGVWLTDMTRPFLEAHKDEPSIQKTFLEYVEASSVPSPIKDDMMRKLRNDYGHVATTPSRTVFTDPQARPPGAEGQGGGSDGLPPEHR